MKFHAKSLFLLAQILLILMALVPPQSFAIQTFTLSVNPLSGTITYPTYTINLIISPVTNLNTIHFKLSFNDGEDFLDVSFKDVVLGDLFAETQAEITILNIYYRSDTQFSYVDAIIEMPGNETVTSSGPKSIAAITFKLSTNAMPGMTSSLTLELADAVLYFGGEVPYQYPKSDTGEIILESGSVTLGYLVTFIKVNPATGMVEKPVALSSTLKDGGGNTLVGLSVDYYVDSVKIGSALTNDYGVSSVSYTPPSVGTFTIKAEYLRGEKYDSSSNTSTLTVNKMSTTLSLSVQASIKVNDEVNLAATLKKDGTLMVGETVNFSISPIGWSSPAITNASGIASVMYTFSSEGTYQIKAEFAGTSKYASSSDTTTRKVAIKWSLIELFITPTHNPKVEQSITLSATLKDYETKSPLPSKNIEYYVNSQKVGFDDTDISGTSSITYTPTEASPPDEGWKVEAQYAGDSTYSSSVATDTIWVSKLATTLALSVAPTTIAIEQIVIMTATLKDENAKATSPSSNIDYYVKVENLWIEIGSALTDASGIASLDYLPTTTGALLIKANYTGSSKYLSSSSEPTIITVNKLATTLTLSMATTTKVEQTIMISATLKDANQKTIPTVTVEYSLLTGVQEQAIGTAKTNQNGIASIPYTPTNVGAFQIKVTYSESTKYLASSDSKALTVNPLTTTLSLNTPTTARVGDTVTLVATLQDENEQALRGVAIEYSIYSEGLWNKIGITATNSSGVATRDYTPSEAGTFIISAKFAGDAKHAETTSQEVTLTVRKVQTTLTISLSNTTTTVQTSIKISATLKDEDTQPIPLASVYYEIFKDGEWTGIGSKTTNLQGVASMTTSQVTDEAGTFRIKAVYSGDSKYAESTSEEANLIVTGGTPPETPPENPFGFLGDNQLTVLDFLFWGVIMLAFATLVVVFIRRKIKSTEMQISANVSRIESPSLHFASVFNPAKQISRVHKC